MRVQQVVICQKLVLPQLIIQCRDKKYKYKGCLTLSACFNDSTFDLTTPIGRSSMFDKSSTVFPSLSNYVIGQQYHQHHDYRGFITKFSSTEPKKQTVCA